MRLLGRIGLGLGLGLSLGLSGCGATSCHFDTDCGEMATMGSTVACDLPSDTSEGACRSTCSSNGKACSLSATAPLMEGNNNDCPSTQHCVCNPHRGIFFCEPK